MAKSIKDRTKDMFSSIGAMQTLTENYPLNVMNSDDGLKFNTSFDVLALLFKILGITREEAIEAVTNFFCGNMKEHSDGSGVVSQIEEIVKLALHTKLTSILNCTTNPIIPNNLLDNYDGNIGEGITLNVSDIDFSGVLNYNPFTSEGSHFYFDIEDYNANTVWKSKDFNAYLWYIINRSNYLQTTERIWDNRYRAAIWGEGNGNRKEIIKCEYVDDEAGNTDKLKVYLCASNYYKTVKINKKKEDSQWEWNKTIFQFNWDFLSSIKLYEPKVMVSEIVEQMIGKGGLGINLNFTLNEAITKEKINKLIDNVITSDDMGVEACTFDFSNDIYNDMLERAEKVQHNIVETPEGLTEIDTMSVRNRLSSITKDSTIQQDKEAINDTLNTVASIANTTMNSNVSINAGWDAGFEPMRMFIYPFIRPLFTPKVIFLLMVNQKIMGSFEENVNKYKEFDVDELLRNIFDVAKQIILKVKDLLIDWLTNWLMSKLAPMVELFTSKLLLENLQMYKRLLQQLLGARVFGWDNDLVGSIDNVNYADIITTPMQTEPGQTNC